MVQIVESEKEYEYELMQCRSCFAVSDEETDVFKIIIGKNVAQATCIKLCKKCMRDLKMELDGLEVNGKLI